MGLDLTRAVLRVPRLARTPGASVLGGPYGATLRDMKPVWAATSSGGRLFRLPGKDRAPAVSCL
jgi:hypothetical protein